MTAISCREKFDKRKSSESVSIESVNGGYRVKRVRNHVRHFEVKTDNKYDDGYVAMQHPDVPRCFDPHPSDPFAYCKLVDPNPLAGSTIWEITCNYSTEVPDPTDEEEDPLSRPPLFWYEFNEIKLPFIQDRDGNYVLNTAGVPYNPSYEVPYVTTTLCFERNEPVCNVGYIKSLIGKTNGATLSGFAPGLLLCKTVDPRPQSEKGKKYQKVNYRFEENPLGWQPRILSRGVFELDSESGKLIRIKDKSGRDITEPIPLDGDGFALSPDDVMNNPNLLEYQEWPYFEEADFAAITNLPFPSGPA